jgi:hypothetical protein
LAQLPAALRLPALRAELEWDLMLLMIGPKWRQGLLARMRRTAQKVLVRKSAATLGWTMREQKAASGSSWWVPEPEPPSWS